VSVPEVKLFLDLIINMDPMSLPDIKDYWSSERKTQIQFFCDNVQRSLFTDNLHEARGEMLPPKKVIGPSKEQGRYMG
jgi:hypothetical protein